MRIIAGAWRGRTLAAPSGETTRPTADRVRQALFDMLAHAPWSPPDGLRGQIVLDAFAGTGSLGLEALSRGAAHATFFERDPAALAALRANIRACRANAAALAADAHHPPRATTPATLIFLDPPYGDDVPIRALHAAGWLAPEALLVIETARDETLRLDAELLDERTHGAARLSIIRSPGLCPGPAGADWPQTR